MGNIAFQPDNPSCFRVDLWFLIYELLCSSYNGNLILIDDFAIEESSKKRDPEKVALSSMFKTVGGRFDLHLSILARDDEMEGETKLSITCFKIDKSIETCGTESAKRPRTSE